MTARPPRSRRVVVVGGGISGLACAHEVLRAGKPSRPVEVSVFEAAGRVGGKLHTIDLDGMPVEAGADSFVVRKPWAVELCNELGLEDQVVIPGSMGAYVWTARGLVPFPDRAPFGIPGEVGELLRWPGLSRGPKLRALLDLVRPARRGTGDESLGELLRRRFGPGMAGTMVEPLLSGLHAADPLRLSVDATFPELRAWERRHGSLLRGARAATRSQEEEAGRQPLFASVWGGLTHLVDRLVGRIGPDRIRIDHPVSAVSCGGGLSVRAAGADYPADSIVLATPAFESARLLREANPEAAAGLSAIPYVSTGVVLLAYPDGSAAKLPEGSGFVVPPGHWTITACTWLSRKWPHPAYGDRAVVRC
ncbi:MAG: protoporphyrinogen oxidase, partial [Actinobacteria bacterium]